MIKNYFSKTAWKFIERIAEIDSKDFARQVVKQCLIDTNYKYVTFIQVLKSSRKIRPL